MLTQLRLAIGVLLCLGARLAEPHVHVVYMTETVPNFVDSTDPNTAYVVGFKTEGDRPPAGL
jgi:hypothetical protein